MKHKTILITGAGSGIGKETTFALARKGHHVIATTHSQDDANALIALAKSESLEIESFKLDITDDADHKKIEDLEAGGTHIEVLINNAGMGETGSLAEVPLERIRKNFEVNVFGTIALTQVVLREMMARKQGTVITISSLAGRAPMAFLNPYSMTKYALSGGMAALRKELHMVAPDVHVSLIEPGAYATGFNEKMMEKKYEWMQGSSYFSALVPMLRARDARFARYQSRNLQGIVRQIVHATEASRPKTRYSAPFLQAIGIRILRAFGV